MAAHIVTAIGQIKDEIENRDGGVYWSGLDAALNISSWTEDLKYEDWGDLRLTVDLKDVDMLKRWLFEAEIHYTPEWKSLGEPRTREEWNRRKYNL